MKKTPNQEAKKKYKDHFKKTKKYIYKEKHNFLV